VVALGKIEIFARSAWVQRRFNLRGLPLIPKRLWPAAPYCRTSFNQFVLWIAKLQLPKVEWAVDVGANHGDFAQAVNAMFPAAKVLLVEPLSSLHRELEQRCAGSRRRWHLARCALGAERGTATLHLDPQQDDVASLVAFGEEYVRLRHQPAVQRTSHCEVRTLDDLCAEQKIDTIDLLKIDVEGFEFETLRGGSAMLATAKAAVVETSLVRRGQDAAAIERMLALLRQAGFNLVELYPSVYSKEQAWLPVEINILARRP
jgi:FkbM family methyltransferase